MSYFHQVKTLLKPESQDLDRQTAIQLQSHRKLQLKCSPIAVQLQSVRLYCNSLAVSKTFISSAQRLPNSGRAFVDHTSSCPTRRTLLVWWPQPLGYLWLHCSWNAVRLCRTLNQLLRVTASNPRQLQRFSSRLVGGAPDERPPALDRLSDFNNNHAWIRGQVYSDLLSVLFKFVWCSFLWSAKYFDTSISTRIHSVYMNTG